MKWWSGLFALGLILVVSAANAAEPNHVGGCVTQNGASSSASVACTLGAGVTSNAGDIAAIWVVGNTGITVSTVTDDKSDSCTLGTPVGASFTLTPVYCLNLTSGAKTFTAMMSGAATLATIIVDTYSGQIGLDVVAQQAQTTPGTGTNAITSGNTASAKINDLVVGATVQSTGAAGIGTIAAGTGYTSEQSVASTLRSEYKTLAAAGATAATFTAGSGSDSFLTSTMTFTIGPNLSKTTGYSVLQIQGPNLSNIKGYAVLTQAETASKLNGYVVLCNAPGVGACPAGPVISGLHELLMQGVGQ